MVETVIRTFFEYFSVLMLALGLVVAIANFSLSHRARAGGFAEQLFRWVAFFGAGITGVYCFMGHIFAPATAAAQIGWETSPFQYEVGMADLTVGVLCLLAFRRDFGFRLAATIAAVIWYGGDAIGHIRQIVTAGNYSPGNAGPWLWSDLLLPVVLVSSLALASRRRGELDRVSAG